MRNVTSIAVFFCLLAGCGTGQNSPTSAVDAFLKAIQEDDLAAQEAISCYKDSSQPFINAARQRTKDNAYLVDVQQWKIVSNTESATPNKPDDRYYTVLATVESNSAVGSTKRTWEFTVWNSEGLFESAKRRADEANKTMNEIYRNLDEMSKIVGAKVDPQPSPIIPDRSNISEAPFCVLSVQPPGVEAVPTRRNEDE